MRNNEPSENMSDSKSIEFPYEQIIPFLSGRPDHQISITHDDIINLQIALYTSKSLEEFLEIV